MFKHQRTQFSTATTAGDKVEKYTYTI